MKITDLGHVAIRCSDYRKSLEFYRDKIGLKEKFSLYGYDGRIQLTYMEVVPGVFVELFPSHGEPVNPYTGSTAIKHVCILVEDIEQAGRELQEKGVHIYLGPKKDDEINRFPVPYEKVMCGAGEYCFYVADPDGNAVEFMEYVEPTTLMIMSDEQLSEMAVDIRNNTFQCWDQAGMAAIREYNLKRIAEETTK